MEYELVKLNASDITKYFQRGITKTQIDNKIINERNKKRGKKGRKTEATRKKQKRINQYSRRRRVKQKQEFHNELGRPPEKKSRKIQTTLWEYNYKKIKEKN